VMIWHNLFFYSLNKVMRQVVLLDYLLKVKWLLL
jgi:hypothetical protein